MGAATGRGPPRRPPFCVGERHGVKRSGRLPARVAIGMGSNVGDRVHNLRFALRQLRRLLSDVEVSSVYETAPRHVVEQPDFLNACCVGTTTLAPRQLLYDLVRIERLAGRRRTTSRYGPRRLDLDLLLYGECIVDTPHLSVPHPRLHERPFVLIPLREIAEDWRVPEVHGIPGRTVAELADALPGEGVERTDIELERS